MNHPEITVASKDLLKAADHAARAVPPVWPLASSVAVNPFLGQCGKTLANTAARLARVAGASVTMPRGWYRARIAEGLVTDADLHAALSDAPDDLRPAGLAQFKAAIQASGPQNLALPTIADLAAEASGIDWPGVIADRFGIWAGGYFDEGHALWAAPRGKGAYGAWRAIATHDLTPEIAGLAGFPIFVADAPENARDAIARATHRLQLQGDELETYFHQLLTSLGGWAQYARYKLWQAELKGGDDATITDFLAIRLIWEEALFERYALQIADTWSATRAVHASPVAPSPDQIVDTILQEAAERAAQRALAETLASPGPSAPAGRPTMQAAFCIDVRSERFRRALESVNPGIQTLGFAGFFGLAAAHRRFASDVQELHLPVLLNPAFVTCSGNLDDSAADRSARVSARAKRAWGRFKLAAVSCFAFVEATGPIYAVKLLRDALGLDRMPAPNDPAPRFDSPVDLSSRTRTAAAVLRAMSFTSNFARLVLLVGHGASVANNPHASALQCGACGGYSGEVNARLLAALLNDPDVRKKLQTEGIEIPSDTVFLGALHDTATDRTTIYAEDHQTLAHESDLAQGRIWLEKAGEAARRERAQRLSHARTESSIDRRSRNWAEIRPEWGLAGCNAFIAAPRSRTRGKSFEGRAFLHDYDWRQDKDYGVLELIMTAPVVVASWISLQYYGSTVAPQIFGGGNKILHNIVGGIGVIEGNGGMMRPGLPWQSVHDGERYIHEPLRLSVCIEAPREAMTDILKRHDTVRALFDNRWLYLFALDDAGRMAWRYTGNLQWDAMAQREAATQPLQLKVVA